MMGDLTAAVRDYRALLARQPKFAGAWLSLDRALAALGKREDALVTLRTGRALAKGPLRAQFDASIAHLSK